MEHQPVSPATEAHVLLEKDINGAAAANLPEEKAQLLVTTAAAADGNEHLLKLRRKTDDSLSGTFRAWIEAHQIGLSINLLLLLALTHVCFPRARWRTRKFFVLSYYDAATGTYTQGWDDLSLVAFWIVAFTALRAATMDYILKPLARKGGIQKQKAMVRFAEQGWLLIYYSVFWTLGMYVYYNSSYWFNLYEMWTNFPTRSMNGTMKWYYLVQFAFWLQQIFVINMEERRRDHWQMFSHHIITNALVFMSYAYYQTKVGNVILCIMDVVDLFLPAAKILKYLGYQTACDIAFGVFILSWTVARHFFYLLVCYSLYATVPKAMSYGCYNSVTGELLPDSPSTPADGGDEIMRHVLEAFREPGGVVCFNNRIRWSFLALLGGLQVITILWFWLIIKVAYKVLSGQGADDNRSDDEGEEEEEIGDDPERQVPRNEKREGKSPVTLSPESKPLEEEVGVDELHFVKGAATPSSKRRSERLSAKRGSGIASGISIPGHSDRKELLGRIGCDKPQ